MKKKINQEENKMSLEIPETSGTEPVANDDTHNNNEILMMTNIKHKNDLVLRENSFRHSRINRVSTILKEKKVNPAVSWKM